jgi:succinyl-diaminopimelate desuccinylase
LVVENLCARVDLSMNRVEVRTDEGGDSLPLSRAKVLFKDLLMLRIYADPEFGAGYRYDARDVEQARANEQAAAERGLDAEIKDSLTGRACTVRRSLAHLLDEVRPLAEELGVPTDLEPLVEMAGGGTNPAGELRRWLTDEIGGRPQTAPSGGVVVPKDLLEEWFWRRRDRIVADVTEIAADSEAFGREWSKMAPLVAGLQQMADERPEMPVQIGKPKVLARIDDLGDRTAEVVRLAANLVRIPSVTNCPDERVDQVFSCAGYISNQLARGGLDVRLFDRGRYPAVLASFNGSDEDSVTLCGHFDVVRPEPDDRQFEPRIDGDYLWGRGSADMKTVVASYMVWMRERAAAGPPYPPFNLLLVGNEENGEGDPFGTPHVLETLRRETGWRPEFMVVGERTGERGDELYGEVCTANRGILRATITARGVSGHTGTSGSPADLLDTLVEAQAKLKSIFERHLTLASDDGWESTARLPFLNVGEPDVYNITASIGVLGLEIRPIPGDDLEGFVAATARTCEQLGLELDVVLSEPGVACPAGNPLLPHLLAAVEEVSGEPAVIGKKKPGSSARFAPGGNQVVWGQTGIGPHSVEERHFIPSIEPYLNVLDTFADKVMDR